jgi:hypothetical protein
MIRRRLLPKLTWTIAILLPLACAGVWIGSAQAPPIKPWHTPMDYKVGGWMLMADGHSVLLWHAVVGSPLPPTGQRTFLGFSVGSSTWGDVNGQLGHATAYGVRFPTLQILTALPLLGLILGRLLRRQAKPGCCRVCGYDLRASPERCPECGTRVGPRQIHLARHAQN